MRLKDLYNASIKLEGNIQSKIPAKEAIIDTVDFSFKGKPYQFEDNVINFLHTERVALGINQVFRLQNAMIDGYLLTEDRLGIAIEFKFALNWNKSNVARSQMINFKHSRIFDKIDLPQPYFGLIFFDHFSNDWQRIQSKRPVANGWYQFYREQIGYDGFIKIHILQLKNGILINPGLLR